MHYPPACLFFFFLFTEYCNFYDLLHMLPPSQAIATNSSGSNLRLSSFVPLPVALCPNGSPLNSQNSSFCALSVDSGIHWRARSLKMSKCCSSGGRGRMVKSGTSLTMYGAFAEELALGWALHLYLRQ
jgi:hypothetical protein